MPIEILHLAYTRYPADTRVKRELAALRAAGRRIAVIALRGPGERAVERRAETLVIRIPGRKSRGGVLSYLLEYAEFTVRARRLIGAHRALAAVQVVHVHTLPDFLLWAALPARRRGARLVFDMHEIFPEFIASRFPGSLGALIAGLARGIERWARRTADLTITVNRPIDELLGHRPIRRTERRIVLHNTADPVDFGAAAQPAATTGSPHDALPLIYHGTLTKLYGLDIAIRAVAQARAAGVPARLTLLGDGPEKTVLERLAAELTPGTVVLEAPIPQAALPTRLRRCAAGVVPTRLDAMTRYSLSTKLLEYVHLGIPVLAARLPSYLRYFDEDALWYWRPGDAADLARALEEFAASAPAERSRRAGNALAAIRPLAWESEQSGLLAAYAELLPPAGSRSASTAAIRPAATPSP
jgi:glycosyltransferase involved in cell wall biosynthesis